jgi:hypothetical protein
MYNEELYMNIKQMLFNDTLEFGEIFLEFEKAHNDCDNCPMTNKFGICIAKQYWPLITPEMIEIVAKWFMDEGELKNE